MVVARDISRRPVQERKSAKVVKVPSMQQVEQDGYHHPDARYIDTCSKDIGPVKICMEWQSNACVVSYI